MEQNSEIRRLSELMPASARMMVKIINKPEQTKVIDIVFPLPGNRERLIYINFDLWCKLTKPQRDILFLRTVSWLVEVKWFKPDISQGIILAGLLVGLVEFRQGDVVGTIAALALSGMGIVRIWRMNNSQELEISADNDALNIAQRRGYSQTAAAENLLNSIETVAKIEERSHLSFNELVRCQNLRAISGLSAIGIPKI
ncbi:DUF3318 domain-containing protein [Calothrix sp. UHCC 0171]|uniref:DUF3318 domain-containing protein n=1 Tax=Calothrix sp. UHCC 0171 TaxID=3110245 RepID=UPI002B202C97|nr:DUF3318 domain-containing protein [Calothrix sp. UHCC 0171]MEA5574259.1 DUF3318 domain-containing protein [Calothrix sp. UHCC 0171]